ncbi:MAG: hypothetical protein NTU98_10960 [Bacteroidetes bacterium]|nr:hypothetical protein [Bacteroidota bacterium]
MQKRITGYLFLVVLFFPAFRLQGQETINTSGPDKPLRIEIPARSTEETYRIVPLDTTGVLLFFKSVETIHDSLTKWYFSLYDKNLRLRWIKSVPVRTGLEFRDYCNENNKISFLFLAGEKTKGLTNTEMILTMDGFSAKFTAIENFLPEYVTEAKCRVSGDLFFAGYNIKNKPAHLQVVDLKSGKISDHTLTSSGTASVFTGFILDTVNSTVFATIGKPVSKNFTECILLKLNYSGTILAETTISAISPGWEIRTPRLILNNADEVLVLSMFRAVKSRSSGKSDNMNGSSGIFSCIVRNGTETDLRFRSFPELKSASHIIGEKDLLAMQKKASKKNKSSIEYAPELNILPHPLICCQDQVIFLGESYSPEYHSENMTEFDFYGRPYVSTYNVFDGYRYNNALIAGFDRSGNLRWDNSMEIRNLISPELVPKVMVYFPSPDTTVLCYSSEGRIASKIIRKDEVVEKLDFSTLDLINPEDKMITDSKNNMLSWYGPYFLCYGYQEIKSINASDKKRLVYYITKVRFD